MSIKYTVVIPTRNRIEYLPYAIKSVLDSGRPDIELIISNNHSSDGTEIFLNHLTDSRVQTIKPNSALPMARHYEFAISHARGEWVTILGDDDAVMPDIFERLDFYITKNPKIDIISSARAYYFWPGCEDLHGQAVISYHSTQDYAIRSTKRDFIAALSGLRSCFDMPQLYTTSIIKRELLNEIKNRSGGHFYHSIIPDMSSVVSLCLSRDGYLRVSEPLFWVGTSNKSMGISDRIYQDAEQFSKDHRLDGTHTLSCISRLVPYGLHSGGFGAVYIYEALLSSPLRSSWHNGVIIRFLVLSSVLNDLRKKAPEDRYLMVSEVNKEAKKYGIPMLFLWLQAFMVGIFCGVILLSIQSKRILGKLGMQPNFVWFRSKKRYNFLTITEASLKIAELKRAHSK